MIGWFNDLDVFYQIVFVLGCASSVVMFIQLILLIIGIDGADGSFDGFDGMDGSIDDVINDGGLIDIFGLRLLTVRNIFIFLSMFCWSSLIIYEWSSSYPLSIIIAFLFATIIVLIVTYVMMQAMKLQNEGNIKLENSIGKKGIVYLTIPANKSGTGKVNVLVQERLCEFEAYTTESESIPTGSEIEVVDVLNNILIVRKV